MSLFTVKKKWLKHFSTHCQFKNINIYVDSYNPNSYTTCAHFSLRFESIMWPNIHYKSIFLLKNVDEINYYYYYYSFCSFSYSRAYFSHIKIWFEFTLWKVSVFWTANEREESSQQMWVLGTKEHCVQTIIRTPWEPQMWKGEG